MMQENISKKLAIKIVTNNQIVSNDTTNVSSDNIAMKTINQQENTKDKLGVTALIVIMEPATESQSSRAYNYLWDSPLHKHKVCDNEMEHFFPDKSHIRKYYLK